jgi:hypothetical protein
MTPGLATIDYEMGPDSYTRESADVEYSSLIDFIYDWTEFSIVNGQPLDGV